MIYAVVLNYNDFATTVKLVEKLKKYECIEKVVVVDNCSTDNSFVELKRCEDQKVKVVRSEQNGGYGYGNNYGIKSVMREVNHINKDDCILICNPDIVIEENVIQECYIKMCNDPDCAVVAPFMLNRNGEKDWGCVWNVPSVFQYIAFSLPILKRFVPSMYYDRDSLENEFTQVGCVAGSCFLVNLQKMIDVGLYDENIFLYCEETVLGIKFLRKGYKSYVLNDYNFLHMHSVSIDKSIKKNRQFKMMWRSRLYVLKEYYNCNSLVLLCVLMLSRIALIETNLIAKMRSIRK